MNLRRLWLSACMTFAAQSVCHAQTVYDIAPLERSVAACTRLVAAEAAPDIPIYRIARTATKVEQPAADTKKRRRKSKKKSETTVTVTHVTVTAKKTSAQYDAGKVLRNGFALTMWVYPQALRAGSRGYILYPAGGSRTYGTMQSQWGIAIDGSHVRVYERQTDELLLLEYRYEKHEDFCVTLVCRDSTPELYIDGELVCTGVRSEYFPHPAFESTSQCPEAERFAGKMTRLQYFDNALDSSDIRGLYNTEYALLHTGD